MSDKDRDRMYLEGEVVDSSKGNFQVKVGAAYMVQCTLSGKIRMNAIRILNGDLVKIEVSEYDTTRGRIVSRLKKQQ